MADNESVSPTDQVEAVVPAPRTPRVIVVAGEMPFSGAAIARVLLEDGFSVRALCPDEPAESAVKRSAPAASKGTLACVRGSVESAAVVNELMNGAFGAAFMSPIALNGRLYRAGEHLNDVRRFCDAVKAAQVKRALYHSSVNAQPLHSSVALSQAAVSDQLFGALECEAFTLKTTFLMGPGDQFQSQVVDAAKSGSPVMGMLGYGSTLLQPIHISDMAQCVARIFSDDPQPLKPGTYVVAGPELTSPLELTDMALSSLGRFKLKLHAPLFALKLITAAGASQALKERVSLLFENFCTDRNDVDRLLGPLHRLITPQQSQQQIITQN